MPMQTQAEWHKNNADFIYEEIRALEVELSKATAQHTKQSLKGKIELKRAHWQVQNLHRQNEELKADALKGAMAQQVKIARNTKESAENSIKQAAREMVSRLQRLAEGMQVNLDRNRIEDLCYNMANELPVILGNSSLDVLGRYRGELIAANAILAMAEGGEQK